MRDGAHFPKPDGDVVRSKKRRWLFDLAVPVVVALVVAFVLMVQLSGHTASRRVDARPSAAVLSARGSAQAMPVTGATPAAASTPVAASTPAASAGAAGPATTTTVTPAGSPPAALPTAPPYLLPDGSALPVLIVFDGGTITLSGAVPSAHAGQGLAALAQAYSKTPGAQVQNSLVVDPRVPASTGVRVIEMNADRFATGSSVITPAYAPELSRVVTLLKAMPNLTALVVGHADQSGDAQYNLTLSEARATAVVEYLSSQGISADRLSAQGVGDQSPLTRQSNAAGLALNRRTEFVFYGLLAGL